MDFDKIKNMYVMDGLSASEIASKVDMTVWQVIRLLKKNGIPRRKASQTLSLKFERSNLSFSVKTELNSSEYKLKLAGLMLYWAEGYKAGGTLVDFANSSPTMVLMFLWMLRKIYQINEKRLRVYLYCYSNQDSHELIRYWSSILDIPLDQFSKPYVRTDYKTQKVGRMKSGMIHLRYSDKRLLQQIKLDIDKIVSELSRDTQAVNEGRL